MEGSKSVILIIAIFFLLLGIYFIATGQHSFGYYFNKNGGLQLGYFNGYFLICMSAVCIWMRIAINKKDIKKDVKKKKRKL
jgi:integral membrane sensor domain MASE1